jgi:hypothetical protein
MPLQSLAPRALRVEPRRHAAGAKQPLYPQQGHSRGWTPHMPRAAGSTYAVRGARCAARRERITIRLRSRSVTR